MGNVVHMKPRGHYLANEAGALAGVSGGRIGQWARRGYIQASQSEPGDYPLVYSYQDVAEAMVVHELLLAGSTHEEVRAAIDNLRVENGSEWPLTHGGVSTAGGAVVVQRGRMHYEIGQRPWQRFIDPTHLEAIADELNRGGWATRQLPGLQHIEVDPDRLSGRPTIRGRRVPVSLVAELATEDDGAEALTEDYGLSEAEIIDAQRWTEVTESFLLAAA
jgi:uncharacterized protein (DUF433 family)